MLANPGFDQVVEIIIKNEGGYVNHPEDPGGETKYGISKRQYPNLEIRDLTIDQAKKIYLEDYWIPARCAEVPERLRAIYFDMVVLQGRYAAVRVLQHACNSMGYPVTIDGVLGPETSGYLTYIIPERLRAFRVASLANIAANNNKWTFFYGWFQRAMNT